MRQRETDSVERSEYSAFARILTLVQRSTGWASTMIGWRDKSTRRCRSVRKCWRAVLVLLVALLLISAYAPPAAAATPAPAVGRYYAQTGFMIRNAAFLDFFDHRGGIRTFGYPISREFTLYGSRVQLFLRGVMQLRPNG